MKHRILSVVCVIIMVLFCLIFSTTEDQVDGENENQESKPMVLGISIDQRFESRMGVLEAIQESAKNKGYCVEVTIAEGDAQTQNTQIESLIKHNVAAILVSAVDQNTILPTLEKAKEKGIYVVAFDRDLPESSAVDTYVGPDSKYDGKICAKRMCEELDLEKEPVKVLELVGALNDQNGIDRSKGWNNEMQKLANVEVIQMPTDWDLQTAYDDVQSAFQANPDIKGIFCGMDGFIPEVERVLKEKGILKAVGENGHIFINGVNGSKDGYEAVVDGMADGFMVMNLESTGKTTVDLTNRLIQGEEVPRVNLIQGVYLTSKNAEANKQYVWGAK